MKRVIAILLCLVLLGCLVACAGDGDENSTDPQSFEQPSTEDVTSGSSSEVTTDNGEVESPDESSSDTETKNESEDTTTETEPSGDIDLPIIDF